MNTVKDLRWIIFLFTSIPDFISVLRLKYTEVDTYSCSTTNLRTVAVSIPLSIYNRRKIVANICLLNWMIQHSKYFIWQCSKTPRNNFSSILKKLW